MAAVSDYVLQSTTEKSGSTHGSQEIEHLGSTQATRGQEIGKVL